MKLTILFYLIIIILVDFYMYLDKFYFYSNIL